jgi:hypothetical protein
MKFPKPPACIIIQGVTRQGRPFRANNWAERLQDCISYGFQDPKQLQSCMLAPHEMKQKVRFSPSLQISFRQGIKSLMVKRELWETNPEGYEFLLNFARDNDLNMIEEFTEE